MKFIAPAKVNLYLHITGRRDDGYHQLDSLFVFTTFGDVITLTPAETISLTIDGPFAQLLAREAPHKNLIYRAAILLQKKFSISSGAHIQLTKNIPIGAGLGGGSSDAAAVLNGLRRFWNLPIDDDALSTLGFSLGADIPACLLQQSALISDAGEKVQPITLPCALSVLLVNTQQPLSTAAVFQQYQRENHPFSTNKNNLLLTDKKNFLATLLKNKNDLESAAIALQPDIQTLLYFLQEKTPCLFARMSGSGATCFALFDDHAAAQHAATLTQLNFPTYWVQCADVS